MDAHSTMFDLARRELSRLGQAGDDIIEHLLPALVTKEDGLSIDAALQARFQFSRAWGLCLQHALNSKQQLPSLLNGFVECPVHPAELIAASAAGAADRLRQLLSDARLQVHDVNALCKLFGVATTGDGGKRVGKRAKLCLLEDTLLGAYYEAFEVLLSIPHLFEVSDISDASAQLLHGVYTSVFPLLSDAPGLVSKMEPLSVDAMKRPNEWANKKAVIAALELGIEEDVRFNGFGRTATNFTQQDKLYAWRSSSTPLSAVQVEATGIPRDIVDQLFRCDRYGNVTSFIASYQSPLSGVCDHWIPKRRGGRTSRDNCVWLHWKANRQKSDRLPQFLDPNDMKFLLSEQFVKNLHRYGVFALLGAVPSSVSDGDGLTDASDEDLLNDDREFLRERAARLLQKDNDNSLKSVLLEMNLLAEEAERCLRTAKMTAVMNTVSADLPAAGQEALRRALETMLSLTPASSSSELNMSVYVDNS